jgi:uncharacterized protein (TIGR00369 family)
LTTVEDLAAIERRVRDSFAKQSFMTTIGAAISAVRNGEVEIVLPFSAGNTQQHGFVHGGVVASIADSACGYAALTAMPAESAVLSVEFKINFLSPRRAKDCARMVGSSAPARNWWFQRRTCFPSKVAAKSRSRLSLRR